ncbi:MAG: trigger factor [Desulfobacterales bacterium]|nr:trigger factor [Desulfobacterales bacterium]
MKSALEVISPVKKKLMVELEPEEVDKKIDETYRNLGKSAKVPGFRPGKIPRKVLERVYGPQVSEEVARELVKETLPRAMDETKTFPLSVPMVENDMLKAGEPFKYTAVLEVKPEFELKEYMGLDVEKEIVHVKEEEVEKQLEEIRKANGRLVAVEEDRPIREGDFAIVQYAAYQDGKLLEELKADNHPVKVGSNEFHPEFEKALVDHKAGDAVRVSVTFEENHPNRKLAGKRVDFQIQVLGNKELKLPDLNDEFAKSLGADFENLEGLRQKIRDELKSREEKRTDRDLKRRLLKKISDKVDFELPESLVEEEINYGIQTLNQNLMRMGSSLQKSGLQQEKLREEFRPAAEKRVKDLLLLGEIARQQGLHTEQSEIDESISRMAEGMNQDPAVVKQYYESNQMVDSLSQRLLEEKTLNFLVKGASIRETEAAQMPVEEEAATGSSPIEQDRQA